MASKVPLTKENYSAQIPALKTLCNLGWHYLLPSECMVLRGSNREVILKPVLVEVLKARQFEYKGKNYGLNDKSIEQIVKKLTLTSLKDGLLTTNERIYDHLRLGITITQFMPDGKKHQPTIAIINWHEDFNSTPNNKFHVTQEFEVSNTHNTGTRRPDIVCFINGLPLIIIEAKRPESNDPTKSTVSEGISQNIRNQRNDEIPQLFAYSQLLLSINGTDGSYATTGTSEKFWAKWQEESFTEAQQSAIKNKPLDTMTTLDLLLNVPKKEQEVFNQQWRGKCLPTDQDRLLVSLLSFERVLEIIRYYILFDKKVGKIVARYQQVFGIKAVLNRIEQRRPDRAREGGVFWHTTGSGKSFSMVLLCKALLLHPTLNNCRIIVVTDRTDLEKQLAGTFLTGGAFGTEIAGKKQGDSLAKVASGKQLAKRIGQGNERIIFTIINKFNTAAKLDECYNPSPDIIVLVDEGHRSHGAENHERMKLMLPKAAYLAFTGTPLLKKDKTRSKFGPIIHSYTMKKAVEDGTVAPLLYEERKPDLDINAKSIDLWFKRITAGLTLAQQTDLKRKYTRKGEIYKATNRIELIAWDIAVHFSENFKSLDIGLKGQLACESKLSAIRYHKALNATAMVTSRVVMSAPDTREGHSDIDESTLPEVQEWWKCNVDTNQNDYEKKVIEDFSTEGQPDIIIVVDKLLTGFDEPRNTVLYIDKSLKEHNIIQAVARVNRLHEQKQFGFLIDYRGILKELDSAVVDYQKLEDNTQGGYEVEDLEGLYSQVNTQYKRLPTLNQKLHDIFADVINKHDLEQYRQVLIPRLLNDSDGDEYDGNQKVRDDFFIILREFALCLKIALSTSGFYADKSFGEQLIKSFKDDLKFYSALRKIALQDAQQTIDYSAYEKQISALVDKQVIGNEIADPDGIYLVSELGKQPVTAEQKMTKARNDAASIASRLKKTTEKDLEDDPYAKQHFSQLLKQVIAETEAMFDHPFKQHAKFDEFEAQLNSRQINDIPTALTHSRHAKAYFGIFKLTLGVEHVDNLPEDELQALVKQALNIENVVNTAVMENSLNPGNIEKEIHKKLLTPLFKLMGINSAKEVINEVIRVTQVGIKKKDI